jgi:hypothetical protein
MSQLGESTRSFPDWRCDSPSPRSKESPSFQRLFQKSILADLRCERLFKRFILPHLFCERPLQCRVPAPRSLHEGVLQRVDAAGRAVD